MLTGWLDAHLTNQILHSVVDGDQHAAGRVVAALRSKYADDANEGVLQPRMRIHEAGPVCCTFLVPHIYARICTHLSCSLPLSNCILWSHS